MAYIVNNSRGQIIAVVQDGTVNTTATSQTLVGKNVTPYGEYEVENLVHQLENFANSTPPGNPLEGQIWYDTANTNVMIFTGTEWKPVNGITVSTSTPVLEPVAGDLWFNPNTQQILVYGPIDTGNGWLPTNLITVATSAPSGIAAGQSYYNSATQQLFLYDGTDWNLVGPENVSGFATTRWTSTTINDSANGSHAVIQGEVDGTTVAFVSSEQFTILESQRPTGFTTLSPGITLSNTSVLSGTATSANQLSTARTINGVAFDGTQNITIGSNGTLTAGTYLLGDPYTGNINKTWSVDATHSNVGSTVVARNSSGDFSARNITANLIGNVTGTATNVSGIVQTAQGGTGFSNDFVTGQVLMGSSTGNLVRAFISGSGPIVVTNTNNGIALSYSGGTGTGNVSSVGILGGYGIGVSGSPITGAGNITIQNTGVTSVAAGNGISVSQTNGNVTITNSGIRSVTAGPGLGATTTNGAVALINSGVTQIIAGANISVSASTGAVTISSTGGSSTYSLPIATSSVLGGVKVGAGLSINPTSGVLNAAVTQLIAGPNITLSPTNGQGAVTISATASGGSYSLPIASGSVLGGVKVGAGLSINSTTGVLSANGTGGGITQILTGTGLTGGPITASGSIAVDSTVIRSNAVQTITSLKSFTGGVVSQAYNFTMDGNSIFFADETFSAYKEPVVQIAVDNFFAHQFYKKRLVIEGSADPTTPGSDRPSGAAIIGIDNGNTGGAGVSGWHTSAQPGLGIGVSGYATNGAFTGAVIQGVSARASSNSFVHIRSYSQADPVFQVTGAGYVTADGTYTSPAGDYAEYFEWADGNPNSEDRVGYSVTLAGNQVQIAQPGDTVIGVVSAMPSFAGDAADLYWNQKFLHDDWGRVLEEPTFAWIWQDENGREHTVFYGEDSSKVPESATTITHDSLGNRLMRRVLNPAYDPTTTYVPRSQRKEWSPIGLVGKLRVRRGQVIGSTWIKLRDINENIEEYLVK